MVKIRISVLIIMLAVCSATGGAWASGEQTVPEGPIILARAPGTATPGSQAKPPPKPVIRQIKVKSPNGGERWFRGKSHTITWSSLGIPGKVVIKLRDYSPGGQTWTLTPSGGAANTGSFTCAMPPAKPGDKYKIKVKAKGMAVSDKSDGYFTIAIWYSFPTR